MHARGTIADTHNLSSVFLDVAIFRSADWSLPDCYPTYCRLHARGIIADTHNLSSVCLDVAIIRSADWSLPLFLSHSSYADRLLIDYLMIRNFNIGLET